MAGLIHPQDVTILFQDGVGAHGATPQQALARFDLIRARHPKTEMIAEAFRPNPTPGGAASFPPRRPNTKRSCRPMRTWIRCTSSTAPTTWTQR